MPLIIVEGGDIVTIRVRVPRRRLGMFTGKNDRDTSGGGARGNIH
jgi:hypothetical protein